jgi:hypothetical protein
MITTAEWIVPDDDFETFVACYDREFGASILTLEFLRGCEEV